MIFPLSAKKCFLGVTTVHVILCDVCQGRTTKMHCSAHVTFLLNFSYGGKPECVSADIIRTSYL